MGLSNAERQRLHRERLKAGQPPSRVRYRAPKDRRSKAQRWSDAVQELVDLQAEYQAWLDSLPENLQSSAVAEQLEGYLRPGCGLPAGRRAAARIWPRLSRRPSAARPADLPGPPGRRTLRRCSTGHPTASFFARSGHRGAVPSERKSGLEIGFDDGKTTQDAIGPAARRPISCGFAGGLIGTACNPLKPWVTSDNSQYGNSRKEAPRPSPIGSWPASWPCFWSAGSSTGSQASARGKSRKEHTPTPRCLPSDFR